MNIKSFLAMAMLGSVVVSAFAKGPQTSVQVQLESVDGKRVSKQLDRAISRVTLLKRLSNDACTAGRDWGYSGRTLWVDDGCRGVFAVTYRDSGGVEGKRRIFTIGNSTNARKRVWVGPRARVELVRKLSAKPCVRGSTWGYSGSYIWVSRGCRAQFAVTR
jgi:hypothetical protein